MDLEALARRVEERLGLEPIRIEFEDKLDDSRLYTNDMHVSINNKYKNDYVECAKCIAHEFRHIFQFCYVKVMDDARSKRWREEMAKAKN